MQLNVAQHSYYLSDKKLTAKNDSQKKLQKLNVLLNKLNYLSLLFVIYIDQSNSDILSSNEFVRLNSSSTIVCKIEIKALLQSFFLISSNSVAMSISLSIFFVIHFCLLIFICNYHQLIFQINIKTMALLQ